MKYLFIHQDAPGQWEHIAKALAQNPDNQVMITGQQAFRMVGKVQFAPYTLPVSKQPSDNQLVINFEHAVNHGKAIANYLLNLKRNGYTPDIICCHVGWGEGLFIKDVFPHVPYLAYAENFSHYAAGYLFSKYQEQLYSKAESRFHFDDISLNDAMIVRSSLAHLLSSYEQADYCITPTQWQFSQYPQFIQAKTAIIHEGINTTLCAPAQLPSVTMPNGTILHQGDEIVTYSARYLEPVRGFNTFMRALPEILAARPKAHVLIMGFEGGVGKPYSGKPKDGGTWKDQILKEVNIDETRVHFLGKQPFQHYLNILRLSSAHIYLTYPFVLSWGMLEAMACECLVIGSSTAPVTEVIEDGKNGILVDLFSPEDVAKRTIDALKNPKKYTKLRKNARKTVIDSFDMHSICLPKAQQFLSDIIAGKVSL